MWNEFKQLFWSTIAANLTDKGVVRGQEPDVAVMNGPVVTIIQLNHHEILLGFRILNCVTNRARKEVVIFFAPVCTDTSANRQLCRTVGSYFKDLKKYVRIAIQFRPFLKQSPRKNLPLL